jgi:hypothetical protein
MKRIAILAALALALVLVLGVGVGGAAQADCFATNCAIDEQQPLSGARQAIIDIIVGVPLSSFTALRDLVARSPGCSVSKSVVIFLNPTIFVSNLIGDNGSLEQPAPSSLQVTMSFDGILERAGRDVS